MGFLGVRSIIPYRRRKHLSQDFLQEPGDAPYLKYLADHYAMSDNYDQAVMGGTGANHVMRGSGDTIWFANSNGNPARPPENTHVAAGSPNGGVVAEIANPNPRSPVATKSNPYVPLNTPAIGNLMDLFKF
jgi:hypothetical protein